MAAVVLLVAMPACERDSKNSGSPPQERAQSVASSVITPDIKTDDAVSTVAGEWKMQRGRLMDRYRLSQVDGVITGEVDATGIGSQLVVTGTLVEGKLILGWLGSGHSEISEDGRAEYEFRFEGTMTSAGWSGRGVMIGRPLANGKRVPVEDSFQTILRKVETIIDRP